MPAQLRITILLLSLVAFACPAVKAQVQVVKQLAAVKTKHAIRIDGSLNEAAWQDAPIATDFIKSFPDFGKPADRRTVVKVLYDDAAVYIGAYMYDTRDNIRKQLTPRDGMEFQNVDVFSVGFDTYHDRQNAFIFQVSAAGVQGDARQSQTGGDGFDRTWDAVWMSSTRINADGWVAEMKIPYSALRFAKKELQDWGLQFKRFTRLSNEESTWNPQNPNVSGNANQWGDLIGLTGIEPPLRLSFLPYLSSGVRVSPTNSGNITEFLKSGGMDVKYGINESFTLDMTLIPDFAQVRSDNVFLNLSPFQAYFEDFRPFFTEGTELFNKAGLFYSRRIGASPSGSQAPLDFAAANHQYSVSKNPGITRLINATKFSGRTNNNLGIGVLNAVGAPMYATLHNNYTGKDSSMLTEPLTNYNIIVLDQVLKHRSSISFTNTNVMRKGNSRNANVSSLDLSFFDKKNMYNFRWSGKFSSIWGKQGSYNGFNSSAAYSKVSGKFQFESRVNVMSDQYDPNDLGFLENNNSFSYGGTVAYIDLKPTKNFVRKSVEFNWNNRYLYKPFGWTELQANLNAFVLFKNFWDVSVEIETKPFWTNDYFEARTPGVLMKRIPYYFINTNGSSDSRKKLYVSWFLGFAESPWPNDLYTRMQVGVRYRFNDRFQLSTNLDLQHDRGAWGYSHRDVVSTMVPGYNDPIVSFRRVRTSNLVLSGQYSFTPRMNWTVRVRHNWTYLHHLNFYKLKPDGYWDEIAFDPTRNRNFNAFNVDMFYTWDFKWGSRITLAWKNALGGNVYLDPYQHTSMLKNLRSSIDSPHSNELSLKIVYFIDYLDLKKKKKRG